MIELHRLDNSKMVINTDMIESIEEMPDTIITLSNGKKYIMRERAETIIKKIIRFKNEAGISQLEVKTAGNEGGKIRAAAMN